MRHAKLTPFLFAACGLLMLLAGTARGDDAARRALRESGPGWYDSQKDTWRSVEPPKAHVPENRESSRQSSSVGDVVGSILQVLLYLLLGLVIGLIVYAIWMSLSQRKAPLKSGALENGAKSTSAPAIRHLPMGLGHSQRNPEEALKQAMEASDWSAVVIWSYATALIRLDAAERIRLRAGMTNRACWRSLQEQRELFRELMDQCERVHFGRYAATRDDADRALRQLECLTQGPASQPRGATATRAMAMLAGCMMLLLSGCGRGLETHYGTLNGTSINGLNVLHSVFYDELGAVPSAGLGDHLVAYDGIVHVSRQLGLPSEEDMYYIYDWLTDEDNRTCLLVLRGDSVTPALCDRWANQALASAAISQPRQAERLKQVADSFAKVALEARNEDRQFTGASAYCDFFDIGIIPATHLINSRVTGSADIELTPRYIYTANAANAFTFDDEEWRPLISLGDRPMVLESIVGSSRMIVVLNGTMLVDGAMPDPNAREVMLSLVRYLERVTPGRWAWLSSLRRWDGEIAHPNMLELLFLRPPFNIIFMHLLVIGLAFMGSRALWLGRRTDPSIDPHPPFSRHIEAFASWLKRTRAYRPSVGYLATWLDVQQPQQPTTEDQALFEAQKLIHQAKRPAIKSSSKLQQGKR